MTEIVKFERILNKYFMDVLNEKLKLIEWLAQLNDVSIIDELKAIKEEKESDWWSSLTIEQKHDIEAGIADLDGGRKTPFSKVISKYK